jgi:hypothetical protein
VEVADWCRQPLMLHFFDVVTDCAFMPTCPVLLVCLMCYSRFASVRFQLACRFGASDCGLLGLLRLCRWYD